MSATVQVEVPALEVVGKPIERLDAREKVLGTATFAFDMGFPNMLYGKVKRSPIPHAEIVRVNVSKAKTYPGVRAVITSADIADALHGTALYDTPTLARDRVRFEGEPVAAVAADTLEVAQEALELVDVEYKELPAINDPEVSLTKDPPVVIHPDLARYARSPIHGARLHPDYPNVCNCHRIDVGDLEGAFAKADLIVENRFTTSMVQHNHLEVQTVITRVEPDGTITVWTSTQAPYRVRREVAQALMVDPSAIRIIAPYAGGGFGNKLLTSVEPICALLSMKTKRPVKMTLTREEVFLTTTVRHPFIIYIKDGVRSDGRIVARKLKVILNGGAYSGGSGIVVTRNCAFAAVATYNIPNLYFEAFRVYTNQPSGGAFRGFGSAQVDWAVESQMDIIAEKLGIDRLQIRAKNFIHSGESNPIGELMRGIDHERVLMEAAKAINFGTKRAADGPWRYGKGIAITDKYSYAPTASMAMIKIRDDEVVEVLISSVEIGAGEKTVFAQMAAEALRVPIGRVKLVPVDTLFTPFDEGAFSSRSTYNVGNAIVMASEDAKRKVFEKASQLLRTSMADLEMEDFNVYSKSDPAKRVRIRDLFGREDVRYGAVPDEAGQIIGKATWVQRAGTLDPETGICDTDRAVAFYETSATAVEVGVNTETGQIRTIDIATALDVGRAINPKLVEGQIEGSTWMGLSSALAEEMVIEGGKVVNADYKDYKIYSSLDSPRLKTIIVETPHPDGPFRAKGCGEGPVCSVAPAVANAIYDATGVRIFDLPITAERVYLALKGS